MNPSGYLKEKKGISEIKVTTKKLAFLCIALNIVLLLQVCLSTVIALDNDTASEPEMVVEEAVVESQGGEMQIMAAAGCNYWDGQPSNPKKVDNNYLESNGINAHQLKYDVLGSNAPISNYNIYKDSNGGLWLYSGSGSYVATYTFI